MRKGFSRALVVPLIMTLAGCAARETPAPLYINHHSPRGGDQTHLELSWPVYVVVTRGDTVYGVARHYRIPIAEIIAVNKLKAPYRLIAGQTLRMPKPKTHTVNEKETLGKIARYYQVDMRSMIRDNNLTKPYIIRAGQELRIPRSYAIQEDVAVVEEPEMQPMPRPKWPERQGKIKIREVKQKQRYDKDGVPLPPVRPAKRGEEAVMAAAPKKPQRPQASKPHVDLKAAKIKSKQALMSNRLPKLSGKSKFEKPVRGRIKIPYGPLGGGKYNDGIDIAVPKGSSVKATENGIVVYTGSELKSFGNLILIKHAQGWTSAYALNSRILVKRGDKVKRGSVIAKSGRQVHFELRRRTRTVDPKPYLGLS